MQFSAAEPTRQQVAATQTDKGVLAREFERQKRERMGEPRRHETHIHSHCSVRFRDDTAMIQEKRHQMAGIRGEEIVTLVEERYGTGRRSATASSRPWQRNPEIPPPGFRRRYLHCGGRRRCLCCCQHSYFTFCRKCGMRLLLNPGRVQQQGRYRD